MSYVGAGNRVFTTTGNLSVPTPTGVATGDLLLAVINFPNNNISQVVGLPPEFTVLQRQAVNAFADSLGVYWGIHTTGTSYTFNISGGGNNAGARIQIFAYRGVGASPIISSAINATATGGSSVTTPIGAAVSGCKEIVYTACLETAARTIVPDATLSLRSQSTVHPSHALADADISSGNTPVRTATGLVSGNRASFNVLVQFNGGGTTPTGTVTIGTITPNSTGASVQFTYSAADQTGFEYRLNGGAAVTGTTSPQVLTGLTSSTAYTIEIRAINASGQGTWSTAANFTTSAPAAQVPQGTVTIGTVTTTQTTASVPYAYSLSDQTGFEYRLNGGAAVTATASPQSLTGLTANTAYTIEIRAINATGAGTWSAVKNFTTAAVATGTFTSEPLHRLVDGALMANKTFTYYRLYSEAGALVANKTSVTSNAAGIVSFTDAAIVAGTTYKSDWLTVDGEFCMPSKAAT